MHKITPLLHHMALVLGIALLTPAIASAQCSAAMESCTASCDSSITSGFIVGMAGALGRNSAAYQQGQRQLQEAQACANRCSAQYDACNQREEAQRQQEEAMRRAQQQAEAQQRAQAQQRVQAQQRAQAEHEALKRRANRVISPPVLPPLAIKDAAPLLLQAQEHERDGNPVAAATIYKMVLQGSSQPRHQQAARAGLRLQALDALTHTGTREPGAYTRLLAEYEPLGVFTPAEQTQLAAMAPESEQAEDAARDYLRKNSKGALRGLAEIVAQSAPQLRARAVEDLRRQADASTRAATQKAQSDENERLATIRNARKDEKLWVRAKGSCRLYDSMSEGTLDIRWTGACKDDYASGDGIFQALGAEDRVLYQYEGSMVAGKRDGTGKVWWVGGDRFEGEYREGVRTGRGTYYWANGNWYVGDFQNNIRAGQGTFYWASGSRYQGSFVDGKRHGVGTYTWPTGRYYQGYWENNEKLNGAEYASDGTLKAICTLGRCVEE